MKTFADSSRVLMNTYNQAVQEIKRQLLMIGLYDLSEIITIQMGIDLCCCDGFMSAFPERLLDQPPSMR